MIGRITAMIRFARCRKFLFQCISIGVILAMVASACLFKLASIQLIDGQMAAARHASGLGPVAYDDPVDLSEYDIAYTKEDE